MVRILAFARKGKVELEDSEEIEEAVEDVELVRCGCW